MKKSRALSWIFSVSKKYLVQLLAVTVGNAAIAAISVAFALVTRNVINSATGGDRSGMLSAAAVLIGMVLVQLLLSVVCRLIESHVSARLEITFRENVFRALLFKDYSEVSRFHSGELINRMFSDVSIVSDNVSTLLPKSVALMTKLICAVAAICIVDIRFALILSVGGIVIFVLARACRGIMKRTHKAVQSAGGRIRSFVQEAIENLIVVKSFKMEEKIVDGTDERSQEQYRAKMKRAWLSSGASAGFSTLLMGGYLYTIIWGAVRLLAGSPSFGFGDFTAIMQLIGQIQTPFSGLSGSLSKYYSAIASAERLLELTELSGEDGEPISDIPAVYDKLDSIRISDVSFAYDKTEVLNCASADITRGKLTLISGISGIGKSTLIKLLMGVLHVNSGAITAYMRDGTSIPVGMPTRGLFAYVPQGNLLMSGTIRENLLLARADASESELAQALRTACADGFVSALDNGLDSVIAERGGGLSEGQIQRLAIARAVLCGAPILLLDEATSALDEETEKKVLQNIMALENRTCVAISHRSAARSVCDCELFVEHGKIHMREARKS